jgi:hypothetical protein
MIETVGDATYTIGLGSVQYEQTGLGRPEAAGAVVERAQVIFEVDVQVLATRRFGALSSAIHQLTADTPVSCVIGNHDVLQPCMDQAIPEHVDETDHISAVAGYYPAKAVPVDKLDPAPPRPVVNPVTEGLGVQRSDLMIEESAPPLVDHYHQASLSSAATL